MLGLFYKRSLKLERHSNSLDFCDEKKKRKNLLTFNIDLCLLCEKEENKEIVMCYEWN